MVVFYSVVKYDFSFLSWIRVDFTPQIQISD